MGEAFVVDNGSRIVGKMQPYKRTLTQRLWSSVWTTEGFASTVVGSAMVFQGLKDAGPLSSLLGLIALLYFLLPMWRALQSLYREWKISEDYQSFAFNYETIAAIVFFGAAGYCLFKLGARIITKDVDFGSAAVMVAMGYLLVKAYEMRHYLLETDSKYFLAACFVSILLVVSAFGYRYKITQAGNQVNFVPLSLLVSVGIMIVTSMFSGSVYEKVRITELQIVPQIIMFATVGTIVYVVKAKLFKWITVTDLCAALGTKSSTP